MPFGSSECEWCRWFIAQVARYQPGMPSDSKKMHKVLTKSYHWHMEKFHPDTLNPVLRETENAELDTYREEQPDA